MTLRPVARKDLRVARADGYLTGYGAMFLLLGTGVGYVDATSPATADVGATLVATLSFFVPLTGLLAGYDAVAAERESGSIRLLCALPHSRRDVVLGTFLGRATMAVAHVAVAVLGAAVVALALGGAGPAELASSAAVAVPTALFAAAFSAIAVGVSASVGRERSALVVGGAVGFGSIGVWAPLATALRFVAAGFESPTGPAPGWAAFLPHLSPIDAYLRTVSPLVSGSSGGEAVSALVLVGWIVVPLAVGLRRCEAAEL